MRNSVCSVPSAGPAFTGLSAIPYRLPAADYGLLARAVHRLCAWLITHYGQPRLNEEEAFLAGSLDHADYERRRAYLEQQHQRRWRDTPLP